jgi:hypothetical protein
VDEDNPVASIERLMRFKETKRHKVKSNEYMCKENDLVLLKSRNQAKTISMEFVQ